MAERKPFSIRKLLYNKKITLPFSIAVAFIFWLVISIDQNPVREQTISDVTVNINTEGSAVEELGLGIVEGGYGQRVNVRVSGPSYIVSSVSASDILVTASLSEVTDAGSYDLTLTATPNSQKTGYSILSVTPAVLSVTFDYIDTKEFTITPQAVGAGAVSGLVAETSVISDSDNATITVRGPRSEMDKISSVVAVAEVNRTLAQTESFDATIMLLDSDGNELDKSHFTLSSETLKITVPISRQKEVALVATFTNTPGAYTQTPISYELSQDTVTIIGPPATVDTLTQIELAPIDFDNISADNTTFDMAPVLPDGVKIVDNIEFVTVTVNTPSYRERTFTVTNIRYQNVGEGLTAQSSRSIRNVKIYGPTSVMRNLSADDLYAEVDLSGKTAGEYTVSARIKSDQYDNIWQVGTYNVIITLQ